MLPAPDAAAVPAADALAPVPPAVAPAAVPSKVTVPLGIVPATLDEAWRLAGMIAKTALVPKHFQNKPEDVLVAIQMGAEVGLAPMQALQSIAVINGRPSIWGDGFLALLMASPLYQDHDEYYEVGGTRRDGLTVEDLKAETTTAVCTFWRRNKGTPVTRRFTVAEARLAGLMGGTMAGNKEGPWRTYPARMLAMRARSWAGRDAFPDLLRGVRTAEEAIDVGDILDTPPPVVRQVQRVSETKPDSHTPPATTRPPEPDRVDEATGEVLPPLTARDIPFGGR